MLKRIYELKTGIQRLLLVVSMIYTLIVFGLIDGFDHLDEIVAYLILGVIWISFWLIVRIVLWVSDGFNKD